MAFSFKSPQGEGAMVYIILTNNPLVSEQLSEDFDLTYQEVSAIEILYQARDQIHRGYRLINHPLSASKKVSQSPYKSIVLTPGKALDLKSLEVIEHSIETLRNYLGVSANHNAHLEDYMFLDYEALTTGLKEIYQ